MSPLRRLFVALLLGGILVAQALVALPPVVDGSWYWPFLDYPMYSQAHHRGEEMRFRKLEALPCDGGEAIRLRHVDLGLQWFHLDNLLVQAMESEDRREDDPRGRLRSLVVARYPERLCAVRIYERSMHLGEIPAGGVDAVPWRLALELKLP